MQTHSSTDQGQRVLKTWENGFPHSGLWAGDLSQFKSRPKTTINSTLKFSISRRVKLWDDCHDLINKRNGSNSWPCTGERQLKMIMWINSDSAITEPSELNAEQRKPASRSTKMSFFPACHESSQIHEYVFFFSLFSNLWRVNYWQRFLSLSKLKWQRCSSVCWSWFSCCPG